MAGEMIENAIRGGKIEGEAAKRSAPRRKNNEVNNTSSFNSKVVTVGQPKVAVGHSIENCTGFKKAVERLIKMGLVKFDSTPNTKNSLSNHDNQGVNAIGEASKRRMKENVAEVRMPMKKEREKTENYCEFHGEEGHETQNCEEFSALVQGFIDNKELQIFEGSSYKREISVLEGEQKRTSQPRIIISLPGNNEVGTPVVPKVIIHKPTPFPYKDSKRIPWNYDCSVTMPEEENIASASKDMQVEGCHTRSGKRYDTGASEWSPQKQKVSRLRRRKRPKYPSMSHVVEQLRKQPARISVLALLLSSEAYREALMKVLNETYVTHDISVNKLDRLVNNISADNFIYFNDDEIPPGGRGSTKALHITTRCKGYILSSILDDNRSALNVLPLSTLNRLPIDDSHMKTCQNVVRAFDGRPWIHSAGAVPSPLHQKLKLVTDERLITINTEEDIIAAVTSKAPYVETNEESIECSFRYLEFVNTTFILEGSKLLVPKIAKATRMALRVMARKGALPGRGLEEYLQGGTQIPKLIEKKDRFGLGFKPDYKQRRKDIEKRQERRRTLLDGREVGWESMTFPPIFKTFISRGLLVEESHQINAAHDKGSEQRNLEGIRPYESESSLNN
ncbi:uncharacterized protein [Gossypium hirsutum]|uniref:Uncharacterized protein n=1 Tax=Gossypium hirsutum TaxID=3635 RepID=A0ABM2YKJ3_GOSHI|nr:uncharacterized protein LOC121203777 [Gossypium hirsutum]